MSDWVNAAMTGQPVNELIHVNVAPTPDNAKLLQSRPLFLAKEILVPDYATDLKRCEWGKEMLQGRFITAQ